MRTLPEFAVSMPRFHTVRCRALLGVLGAWALAVPATTSAQQSNFAVSYNRPAGIECRLAPGLGLGYDILRAEESRLSVDAGFNWVGELFADETRASSLYFNVAQEFRLRVNETTDLEQRLTYSSRHDYDSTPFVDPETGEARSRNDFTFITGLNVTF